MAAKRVNMFSNKGKKLHRKLSLLQVFCISFTDEEKQTYPTRQQAYNKGISLGLPSDFIGQTLACAYHGNGEHIDDEEHILEQFDKTEARLFDTKELQPAGS